MNNLPIKASLTTKEGFHKCIDIPDMRPVIKYAMYAKIEYKPDLTLDYMIQDVKEFYLERHREVKQKNGLHHIVAVYKEI